MPPDQFGRQLIATGDLDPVYIVLWESKLDRDQLCRWLVAYWCFYHCGTASWVVDQPDYWAALMAAASTKKHPRASERRHFRGQAAIKAVNGLREWRLTCSEMVYQVSGPTENPPLSEVVRRVKQFKGFGDWIAFKVADMLERLDLCAVYFSPTDVFNMYDAPRAGAKAICEYMGVNEYSNQYLVAYNYLKTKLAKEKAPPRYERPINIQEIETICCKYKSHCNGKYTVGKDIHEVHEGLDKYKHKSTTAQRLLVPATRLLDSLHKV